MKKTYTPDAGSLAWKVIQFLTTNPSEDLDREAISAKFDCPALHVHTMLTPAVDAGVLIRSESLSAGELVYTLGTPHPAVEAAPGRHPTIKREQPSALPGGVVSKQEFESAVAALDLNAIVFQSNVPVPVGRNRNGTVHQWPAVFERMSAGESFAVPVAHRATLSKAMTDFHKAEKGQLTMRKVSEAELRVWRLS